MTTSSNRNQQPPGVDGSGSGSFVSAEDASSIAWLHDELRRTLESADKLLRRHWRESESHAGSDVSARDLGNLRGARALIHQCHGALVMVGASAAAQLLAASDQALGLALEKPSRLDAGLVDKIEQASFAVVDFLGRQLAGRPVSALYMFAQLRAVLEAVGAERIHPADLWEKPWQARPLPLDAAVAPRFADQRSLTAFEQLTLANIRTPSPLIVTRLSELCAGLAVGAPAPEQSRERLLWQLAAAVFEALATGLLLEDVFSKRLASRLLALLRASLRGAAADDAGLQRLAHDLLFFCAQSQPPDAARPAPRLATVRAVYGLDNAAVDYSSSPLGRFDPALVVQARKRVQAANLVWSSICAGEFHHVASLRETFSLVGDSLSQLFDDGPLLEAQLQATATHVQRSGAAPVPAFAMEVATSLLYVEAALEETDLAAPIATRPIARLAERIAKVRAGAAPEPLEPWIEALYGAVEGRRTARAVVDELRTSLGAAEQQLDRFVRDRSDLQALAPVPGALRSMRGALAMLGVDQAVPALQQFEAAVGRLAAGLAPPQATQQLEWLAANFGTLGFLIDMLGVQPVLAQAMFRFDADSGSLLSLAAHGPATGALQPSAGLGAVAADRIAEPPLAATADAEPTAALPFDSATADTVVAPFDAVSTRADELDLDLSWHEQPEFGAALPATRAPMPTTAPEPVAAPAPVPDSQDQWDDELAAPEFGHSLLLAPLGLPPDLPSAADLDLDFGPHAAAGSTPAGERWAGSLKSPPPPAPQLPTVASEIDGEDLKQWLNSPPPMRSDSAGLDLSFISLDLADPTSPAAAGSADDSLADSIADSSADDPPRRQPQGEQPLFRPPPAAETDSMLQASGLGPPDFGAAVGWPEPGPADQAEPRDLAQPATPGEPGVDAWSEPPLAVEPAAQPDAGGPAIGEWQLQFDDVSDAYRSAADRPPMHIDHGDAAAADEWPADDDGFITATTAAAGSEPARNATEAPPQQPDWNPSSDPPMPDQPLAGKDGAEFTSDPAPAPAGLEPVQSGFDSNLEIPVDPAAQFESPVEPETPAADAERAGWPGPAAPADPAGHAEPAELNDSSGPTEPNELFELSRLPELPELPEPTKLTELPKPPEPPAPPKPAELPELPELPDTPDTLHGVDEEHVKPIGPLRVPVLLFNIFLNEADEASRRLCTELAEWAVQPALPMPASPVELAHGLAGSSATVGFADLADLARQLEAALAREQQLGWHGAGGFVDEARLYCDVADEIRQLLHQFAAGFLKSATGELLQRLAVAEQAALNRLQLAQTAEQPATAAPSWFGDIDAIDEVDGELFPIFDDEAHDLLPQLSAALRDWVRQPDEATAAAAAMRHLHTFKGGARLVGAMRLGEMAHRLETRIEALAAAGPGADRRAAASLLAGCDVLQHAFEALRQTDARDYAAADAQALAEAIEAFNDRVDEPLVDRVAAVQSGAADDASAADAAAAAAADIEAEPVSMFDFGERDTSPLPKNLPGSDADNAAPEPQIDWSRFAGIPAGLPAASRGSSAGPQASVKIRAALLERMVRQAGEVNMSRARIEVEMGQVRGVMAELNDNVDRLRRQLGDMEMQAQVDPGARSERPHGGDQPFEALEIDRYTRMQELTRMMVESVNDVATVQRSLRRNLQRTDDELAAQARLTRELQGELLRTRMVEFDMLAERLHRVVRQAASESGRAAELQIVGGSFELDRSMLERLTPAFEHLLRNAVVHGIEDVDTRLSLGKPAIGQLELALHPHGNEVRIDVRDDGAGLDMARIRARAEALGEQNVAGRESDLIFNPGFSTAERLTEMAGRGVGLDIVRTELSAVDGQVELNSWTGLGCCFSLTVPLTTAMTQVLMLRCGDLNIAVPSMLVEHVRRLDADELAALQAGSSYRYGDLDLPFHWLGALLQHSSGSAEPFGRSRPLLIVRSGRQRLALHVDEVLGQQEAIVKHLGPQLSRIAGLAGTTVLASGAVALIYNPLLLAAAHGDAARHWRAAAAPAAQRLAPLLLVVDDSLTVRRVTQRMLVREGYRVMLAKDGVEALERIADEMPQLILSDIEMPRMDGYELLRRLRSDPATAALPVVMITSRSADKHRRHAESLGVSDYLGKPYADTELLGAVARLL